MRDSAQPDTRKGSLSLGFNDMPWMEVGALTVYVDSLEVQLFSSDQRIQCFHCSGMTNYDPDGCFHPDSDDIMSIECDNDEICEVSTVNTCAYGVITMNV